MTVFGTERRERAHGRVREPFYAAVTYKKRATAHDGGILRVKSKKVEKKRFIATKAQIVYDIMGIQDIKSAGCPQRRERYFSETGR